MRFSKYQALGNDYLVLEEADVGGPLSADLVRALCDRHFGVGADGVLLALPPADPGRFGLRIFNPDGSEAEKSGNGIRIYARYLFDRKRVDAAPFHVDTPGGPVACRVLDEGDRISAAMGPVRFRSAEIPARGPEREVLRETIEVLGRPLEISAASVGNPHCVVLVDAASAELAKQLGPQLEHHPLFPKRANVQLVQVLGAHAIRIEIWERGVGYTLASGTSSCAAAAVCCRLRLCKSPVRVQMPGGELRVEIDAGFAATLTGPARKICEGVLSGELLAGPG
jgi:diaminopimelate epimerase